MNGGPSGFNNAPITRTFVIASCLFTILFGIQGRSSKLGLSYQLVPAIIDVWSSGNNLSVLYAFAALGNVVVAAWIVNPAHSN